MSSSIGAMRPAERVARVLLAGITLFGATVAAARVAVLLHEAGGHLAMAALLGAPPDYLQVTLMSGGQAGSAWKSEPGPAASAAVSLAGIGVQTVVGLVMALALRGRAPGGAGDLFLRVLAAGCATGGIHYLVVGGYYRAGDPAPWPWLWPPALALAVPVCALTALPLGRWIASRVAGDDAGAIRRIITFIAVAAIAGAGYLALARLLHQDDDHAAIAQRQEREEQAIADARAAKAAKIERDHAVAAAALAERGEPVPDALRAPVRPDEIEVAPEDVKKPFPIEVPLGACYVIAAIIAACRKSVGAAPVGKRDAIVALAIGAAALLLVLPIAHGIALGHASG